MNHPSIPHSKFARGRTALLSALAFSFSAIGCNKGASPHSSTSCDLGDGRTLKTEYASPRMKGRRIYGGLVPFGKVWRAGANAATTFTASSDVLIDGVLVPAGNYTLFTVPEPDKWTLIINKKTGEWGIPYKYKDDELTRVPMKVSQLESPVEAFTIAYDKTATGCTLRIDWETTRASVDIRPK